MNRFVFIICLFCFWVSIDAQNLIYNGSFEEYYSCPVSNDLNNDQLELAKGWWKPTNGTSDYFNACNNGVVSVPTNFWGFQPAHEGLAYVGFGAIDFSDSGQILGMEFVQTKLKEQLKPCSEYTLTMYVSLANKSEYGFGDIAAFFSNDSIHEFIDTGISLSPTVINDSEPIIDTLNWTPITLTFIADGTEKFLTLGYKGHDYSGDTTYVGNDDISGNENYGYYYLDNIELKETGSIPFESCNLGEVILPNIITPNNDGINDFIDLKSLFSFNTKVKIFNRWGNVIADLDSNNFVWNGDNLSEGVYFYLIEFTIGNKEYKQNGFIQLLR